MHFFFLVPFGYMASDALEHAYNKPHCLVSCRCKIPRPVNSTSGPRKDGSLYEYRERTVDSMPVSITPQLLDNPDPWQFRISSNLQSKPDLYLQSSQQHGDFDITFRYLRAVEYEWEPPTLNMLVSSTNPDFAVEVRDPLHWTEPLPAAEMQRGVGQHYLREPQTIRIGPYLFEFGYPLDNEARPIDAFKIQKAISSIVDLNTETDRFRQGRLLGSGGFGDVYLAHGMKYGIIRAMKIVKGSASKDRIAALAARERDNMELACKDRLRNVMDFCEYYIVPTADGIHHHFILQPCHGSVRDLLKEGMGRAHFPDIAEQASLGMEHLHELGMVHRDLKPENILFMITTLGMAGYDEPFRTEAMAAIFPSQLRFCISDFGLARKWTGDCHSLCGTSMYVAPEMESDGSRAYGLEVDVFSLGVTLVEVMDSELVEKCYMSADGDHRTHTENRLRRDQFYKALLKSRNPRSMDIIIWEFLKAMIALEPSQRPSMSEVARFFKPVHTSIGNNASQGPILIAHNGQAVVAQELRIVRERGLADDQSIADTAELPLSPSRESEAGTSVIQGTPSAPVPAYASPASTVVEDNSYVETPGHYAGRPCHETPVNNAAHGQHTAANPNVTTLRLLQSEVATPDTEMHDRQPDWSDISNAETLIQQKPHQPSTGGPATDYSQWEDISIPTNVRPVEHKPLSVRSVHFSVDPVTHVKRKGKRARAASSTDSILHGDAAPRKKTAIEVSGTAKGKGKGKGKGRR